MAAREKLAIRVLSVRGGRICGSAGDSLPTDVPLSAAFRASYARALHANHDCPLSVRGRVSRHALATGGHPARRFIRTGCYDWYTNDPGGSGTLVYGGGDTSGCDTGGVGAAGVGTGSAQSPVGPGETGSGAPSDGTGGSGASVCSGVVAAINKDDVDKFLQALANAFNFSWTTDLGPKVNSFRDSVQDNVKKFGKGNDVGGRVYDHAQDMFGKAASQLSGGERQMYDWMKYAGPTFRDPNRGFWGTQMTNPNFELYAIPSEKWINVAQYNGVTTTLTKGNYVITFFDRGRNMWVSTYEVTKDDLQRRAASFLRVTQQSYEPGWDPAMEDDPENFDWSAYDAAVDSADAAAVGC